MKRKTISVLIPTAIDSELTYYSSQCDVKLGDVVVVPLRRKAVVGVIWSVPNDSIEEEKSFLVKEVSEVLPFNIDGKMRSFIDWVASYNIANRGMVLKMMLGQLVRRHKQILKLSNNLKLPNNIYVGNIALSHQHSNQEFIRQNLSQKQYDIYNSIIQSLYQYNVNVIRGTTGSGKTELYLQIARFVVSQGGQILILLPEILLSTQITERITTVLKDEAKVYNWHSQVKQGEKDRIWLGVQNQEARIVVGARSALFLPFSNLQLIIVDEEHDGSFKQESAPIYDAKNMAVVRAKIHNIPLLLVSATPSIETIYNVKIGKYRQFSLDKKFFIAENSNIIIADMWEVVSKKIKAPHVENLPLLHPTTAQQIQNTLNAKQQVLLFLNKKAYASTVFCSECLARIKCINCDAKLMYYQQSDLLYCRYCNYSTKMIDSCTACGAQNTVNMYGYGIEKLEKEVREKFANATVLLMTADLITDHKMAQETIHKIVNNEIDIIIGTQIIAKGLHFSNMALCIVVDANTAGFNGDIRGLEKTYQLLHQVMGRVGREKNKGTVILQTFSKKSQLLQSISQNKSDEFLDLELKNRELANLPPYGRFIIVNISGSNEIRLKEWLRKIAPTIPEDDEGIKIFGPTPALINRINRKYRYTILFKSSREMNLSSFVKSWISSLTVPANICVSVDVDPQNFW